MRMGYSEASPVELIDRDQVWAEEKQEAVIVKIEFHRRGDFPGLNAWTWSMPRLHV